MHYSSMIVKAMDQIAFKNLSYTCLLIAAAKYCKSSLVFSGSCPATILPGFADIDFPVTKAIKKIRAE